MNLNDEASAPHATDDTRQRPRKTGRTRYLRLFPERLDFLLARLSGPQIAAYMRVTTEYVVRDGQLPDDNRRLSKIAGQTPRAWTELRDTLSALGIAHGDGVRWIDPDQDTSLRLQREYSERQRERVMKRYLKVVAS